MQISHNHGKGVSLFRSFAFLEDCHLTSNSQGAMSLAFTSSAALRHCDVRKNGSHAFMVGSASDNTRQEWEYEDGDCFLYSQECTGDEKSMAAWLGKKKGKHRWMGDDPEEKSTNIATLEHSSPDDLTMMNVACNTEEDVSVEVSETPTNCADVSVVQDSATLTHPLTPSHLLEEDSSTNTSTSSAMEITTSALTTSNSSPNSGDLLAGDDVQNDSASVVVKTEEDDSSPMEIL
jgi:hypothetical protein